MTIVIALGTSTLVTDILSTHSSNEDTHGSLGKWILNPSTKTRIGGSGSLRLSNRARSRAQTAAENWLLVNVVVDLELRQPAVTIVASRWGDR